MTHPNPLPLTIRPLRDAASCRQAEEVQLAAWGRDARSITPAHVLLTAAHGGGVVLGAFAADEGTGREQMVGFSWGFLGLRAAGETEVAAGGSMAPAGTRGIEASQLKLCSHQTGVLPEWQGHDVGFRLKCAQRAAVLARGLDLVTWTFDPLETPNANLNIAKLGATCNTYRVNHYGDGLDGPSAGLPTDRLVVDWWVASPRVAARLATRRGARTRAELAPERVDRPPAELAAGAMVPVGTIPLVNETTFGAAGLPQPPETAALPGAARLLLEVPAHFQALKKADAPLAQDWRLHVRTLLLQAFEAGYFITDFVFEGSVRPRAFYLLEDKVDGGHSWAERAP